MESQLLSCILYCLYHVAKIVLLQLSICNCLVIIFVNFVPVYVCLQCNMHNLSFFLMKCIRYVNYLFFFVMLCYALYLFLLYFIVIIFILFQCYILLLVLYLFSIATGNPILLIVRVALPRIMPCTKRQLLITTKLDIASVL